MSRVPDLRALLRQHGLPAHVDRRPHPLPVPHRAAPSTASARPASDRWGPFRCIAYRSVLDDVEHLAFVPGDVASGRPVLVGYTPVPHRRHLRLAYGATAGPRLGRPSSTSGRLRRRHGRLLRATRAGASACGRGSAPATWAQDFDTVDANLELGLPVDNGSTISAPSILAELGIRRMRLMTTTARSTGASRASAGGSDRRCRSRSIRARDARYPCRPSAISSATCSTSLDPTSSESTS